MLNKIIAIIIVLSLYIENSTSMSPEKAKRQAPNLTINISLVSQWRQINQLVSNFIGGDADRSLIGIDFDGVLSKEDSVTALGTECTLADPDIPAVLAEWTTKGYKATIVTSVCSIFAPWRAQQKQFLGIDFISAIKNRGSLREDSGYRIDSDNGILYSAYITGGPVDLFYFDENEGKYLFKKPTTFEEVYETYTRYQREDFLWEHLMYFRKYPEEKLKVNSKGNAIADAIGDGFLDKPKKLVFIDDNIENLGSIASMCTKQNILYLLMCYDYESAAPIITAQFEYKQIKE
jgi:hypothetical protein